MEQIQGIAEKTVINPNELERFRISRLQNHKHEPKTPFINPQCKRHNQIVVKLDVVKIQ